MTELSSDSYVYSALKSLESKVRVVVLSTGVDENGSSYYAYVLMSPLRYVEYLRIRSSGNFDLGDYGEIVSSGFDSYPPPEVQREMQQKYGASAKFEGEMDAIFSELLKDKNV